MLVEKLSLEALYYDTINLLQRGRSSKDFPISPDQVKSWIIQKRWKYINQSLAKDKKLEPIFYQSICVDMEFVNSSLCCDVDLGCTFLRSTIPLPQYIQVGRIGNIDGTKAWQIVEYDRIPLEKYAPKYSLKKPKFYFKDEDNYLYCYFDKTINPEANYLTKINVNGIQVDPRKASEFNCSGSNCYSDNDSFPISMKMWELVRTDLIQNEFRIALLTVEDDINDNKSELISNVPTVKT